MKLYKSKFCDEHSILDASKEKLIKGYVRATVNSCYNDLLQKNGIFRRQTKSEKERDEKSSSYAQVYTVSSDDEEVSGNWESDTISPEHAALAKQSYKLIKGCFESAIESIDDAAKQLFLIECFWSFDNYDMNVKELAAHLNYKGSNPTQDLNRFSKKVGLCTQPHGVNFECVDQIRMIAEVLDGATEEGVANAI